MENTLILGKTEGRRRSGGPQKMRWLDDVIDPVDMNLSKSWETVKPGRLQFMGSQRVNYNLATGCCDQIYIILILFIIFKNLKVL